MTEPHWEYTATTLLAPDEPHENTISQISTKAVPGSSRLPAGDET